MNNQHPRQLVEQFHLLFLDQLGRKLDKKLYALKGGCNLRFYFKSPRYSEDMDLDIQIIAKDTLRKKINLILKSTPFKQILQTRAIKISQISEPKQTQTTQRWKLSLITSTSEIPVRTKIEFSRRGLKGQVKFSAVEPELIRAYHVAPILINHYSGESAFEQKVEALIGRSETQARDIFDLYLLINSGYQPIQLGSKILSRLSEARANALAMSFADYKSQVVAYLTPEYQETYGPEAVWDDMVLTVVEALS